MTTSVTLAGPDDLARVVALMERYHSEAALPHDDAHRALIAGPLLEGSPLGAVWLIGPARAPLGYIMITFGWSVPYGGMIGWLAEVFVRPSVRNRGIGTETLHAVSVSLREAGIRAMLVQLGTPQTRARQFCARAGFDPGPEMQLMIDKV